jgi:hypothetical protein
MTVSFPFFENRDLKASATTKFPSILASPTVRFETMAAWLFNT